MEVLLVKLWFPISVAIVVIALAIADRIGSERAIELDSLRKQNTLLKAELEKLQEKEASIAK